MDGVPKYQAGGDVSKDMESIPWVRCASGNVSISVQQFINRFPKVVVGDISFIDFKVDHQVEVLSWLHCLGCPVEIISLSIELISLSARVTSIKSSKTSLT